MSCGGLDQCEVREGRGKSRAVCRSRRRTRISPQRGCGLHESLHQMSCPLRLADYRQRRYQPEGADKKAPPCRTARRRSVRCGSAARTPARSARLRRLARWHAVVRRRAAGTRRSLGEQRGGVERVGVVAGAAPATVDPCSRMSDLISAALCAQLAESAASPRMFARRAARSSATQHISFDET